MKYKYYTANIACRDNRTRTLTITTDATDNTETKHIDLTALQIQMPTDTDIYSPLRPQSGTITIVCNDGISPLDFMPSNYFSHRVEIKMDNTVTFHGYIDCSSLSQSHPSEGEEFDINIISPLGLAESIRFEIKNSISPHNILSNELDDIFWLITYGYVECGGYQSGRFITQEKFAEKIARHHSIESIGDLEIDVNYILKPLPEQGKTYADILRDIAVFYGVTFYDQGLNLYAASCNHDKAWWQANLSADKSDDLSSYGGDMIYSNPIQRTYGNLDIEPAASRVAVSCAINTTDNILDFSESNLWRPHSFYNQTKSDFDFQAHQNDYSLNNIGFGVIRMSSESVNGNMTANTTTPGYASNFATGGSFCVFTDRSVQGDHDSAAPSGLVLVSSNPTEDHITGVIRSKSAIYVESNKLYLKFTVAAIVQQGNDYQWCPACNPVGVSCGNVYIRVRVGSTLTSWVRATALVHEVDDDGNKKYYYSDISSVDCSTAITLPASMQYAGAVVVEIKAVHGTSGTGKLCTQMFIYNIEMNRDQGLKVEEKNSSKTDLEKLIAARNEIVRIFGGKRPMIDNRILSMNSEHEEATTNFRFSQATNYKGEEYVVNLPFAARHQGCQAIFQNGIYDKNGNLYGENFKMYEKQFLSRIFPFYSKPRLTYTLPVNINAFGLFLPYFVYKEEKYMLTGLSRDYMTGFDTLSITKIS